MNTRQTALTQLTDVLRDAIATQGALYAEVGTYPEEWGRGTTDKQADDWSTGIVVILQSLGWVVIVQEGVATEGALFLYSPEYDACRQSYLAGNGSGDNPDDCLLDWFDLIMRPDIDTFAALEEAAKS